VNDRAVAAEAAAIAAAVQAVPGVARLSAGPVGAVATYGPGPRIAGVRVRGHAVEVHVVAASATVPLHVLAARIRAAVHALLPAVSAVDVVVEDLEPEVVA
jgi:hypothetical protein